MNKRQYINGSRQVSIYKINDITFEVRISKHADDRLQQRKLDIFMVTGAIFSLGQKRINDYRDTGRDIFVMDKTNDLSVVCCIEGNIITIITVLDKADCYVKNGTDVINL